MPPVPVKEKCYSVPVSLYSISRLMVPGKATIKCLSEKLRVNTEEDNRLSKYVFLQADTGCFYFLGCVLLADAI